MLCSTTPLRLQRVRTDAALPHENVTLDALKVLHTGCSHRAQHLLHTRS
jgi:hypothetical protein